MSDVKLCEACPLADKRPARAPRPPAPEPEPRLPLTKDKQMAVLTHLTRQVALDRMTIISADLNAGGVIHLIAESAE